MTCFKARTAIRTKHSDCMYSLKMREGNICKIQYAFSSIQNSTLVKFNISELKSVRSKSNQFIPF